MVAVEDVDFAVDIDTKLPVSHSKLGISSIIINLLTNASKYTGDTKKIALKVTDEDDAVVVRVEDNGIGIPDKELERIFDPFYRVDSSLSGKAAGAGLGLAIVNHLVRSHSGTISINTAEGQGSAFIISLPAALGVQSK
jgi:two-component system phosphate regulon sensor histidine kinase PhoR